MTTYKFVYTFRSLLKIGINEVSRCIEKDEIACCLIAEDVANGMIVKHLLYMTATKNIPVLILPDMRSITKRLLGFSAATLGLKVCIYRYVVITVYNIVKYFLFLEQCIK